MTPSKVRSRSVRFQEHNCGDQVGDSDTHGCNPDVE